MKRPLLPHKTIGATSRERRQLVLLGFASIYDGLVTILSLGFYTTEIRAWLLFEVFPD